MDDDNCIQRGTCDTCGCRGQIGLIYLRGTPVFGACKGCDPSTFESIARRDIGHWLDGGFAGLDYICPPRADVYAVMRAAMRNVA